MKKIFDRKAERRASSNGSTQQPASIPCLLRPAGTVPLGTDREEAPVSDSAAQALAWHGMTDTGRVRTHNEDNFACQGFERRSLFVVADGMGGHDAGEVASRIAVETVGREAGVRAGCSNDPRFLLEHCVRAANDAVKKEGGKRGSDMGTTLSLALIEDARAHICHVGDSRVYWIANGSITQITEDHSLVAKLVSAGKLTKAEARNHSRANLLYRSIGTDEAVEADSFTVELKTGGTLLLCTDGLWGELSDEEILRICSTERESAAVCAELLKKANENGGRDNLTAVVIKVG